MLRCKLKSVLAVLPPPQTLLRNKMLLLQVEETCCNNELASTFFNKFLICCSYYHPRNKFMRNKIWETSSDWSKLALQHSANFLTAKMNWKQKLSEGQKCEYRSSITNRSTSCGTTILFSPNQNVQSRHPSTSSPLLTSLTKAHLFSDVLEDLEELPADFCLFSSLFTSRTNAVRTLCEILFKLSEEILHLQHKVSLAIASLFSCVCSCSLTSSFPKDSF